MGITIQHRHSQTSVICQYKNKNTINTYVAQTYIKKKRTSDIITMTCVSVILTAANAQKQSVMARGALDENILLSIKWTMLWFTKISIHYTVSVFVFNINVPVFQTVTSPWVLNTLKASHDRCLSTFIVSCVKIFAHM